MNKFRKHLRNYENMAATVFLVAALILPRISAVLVEFIPGVDMVVICTGSEYVTMTLGPDGTPIDVATSQDSQCTLSDTTAPANTSQEFWKRLAQALHSPYSVQEHTELLTDRLARLETARAPPAVI